MARKCPILTDFGQSLAKFGQRPAKVGQGWPTCASFGRHFANFGRLRSHLRQHWPNLVAFGLNLVDIEPCVCELGLDLVDTEPTLAESLLNWARNSRFGVGKKPARGLRHLFSAEIRARIVVQMRVLSTHSGANSRSTDDGLPAATKRRPMSTHASKGESSDLETVTFVDRMSGTCEFGLDVAIVGLTCPNLGQTRSKVDQGRPSLPKPVQAQADRSHGYACGRRVGGRSRERVGNVF